MPSDAEALRDFELMRECMANDVPLRVEGEYYSKPSRAANVPHCHAGCSFRKIKGTASQPILFVCRDHNRIHVCGDACRHQIISREGTCCEWTGEDMCKNLIAERVNKEMIKV